VQKNNMAERATCRQRQRSQAQRFAQRTGIVVPERAQENLQADDARIVSEFLHRKETA
jgi:hypothetical protein